MPPGVFGRHTASATNILNDEEVSEYLNVLAENVDVPGKRFVSAVSDALQQALNDPKTGRAEDGKLVLSDGTHAYTRQLAESLKEKAREYPRFKTHEWQNADVASVAGQIRNTLEMYYPR